MNYFVARPPLGVYKDILTELSKGRLRFDFGWKGLDLRNNEDKFVAAYVERCNDTKDSALTRYRRLSILKDIRVGDIILIPQFSIYHQDEVGQYFTIAECTETYNFATLPKQDDLDELGHIIGVNPLKSFDYRSDSEAANCIADKLRLAFRSRTVSRINDPNMIAAVKELLEPLPPPESDLDSLMDKMLSMQSEYLDGLLKILKALPTDAPSREDVSRKVLEALRMFLPDALKKFVKDLFVNNGYRLLGEESGGFVFELFSERELMHDIYKIDEPQQIFVLVRTSAESCEKIFATFEQVKNTHMRILIDLTEQTDDTTAAKMKSTGVILIDGLTFANILARHKVAKNRT